MFPEWTVNPAEPTNNLDYYSYISRIKLGGKRYNCACSKAAVEDAKRQSPMTPNTDVH